MTQAHQTAQVVGSPTAPRPSVVDEKAGPVEEPSPQHHGDEIGDNQAPKSAKTNRLRLVATGYFFFIAGVTDGSVGTLIPYLIQAYRVDTTAVSSVYGTAFFGWVTAAITNTHLSERLGLGAMLLLGCLLQLIGSALRAWAPPFGLLAVTFFLSSLGQAYQDTQGNIYAAGAKNAHRWLSYIHSMYSGGCLVGPFVANAIASANLPSQWNLFYLVPVGLNLVNLALVAVLFRESICIKRGKASALQPLPHAQAAGEESPSPVKAGALIKGTLRLRALWNLGLFYFFYLGTVLTAGGWVVEFLVSVRNGDLAQMGYVPAGFNGGSFIGRLLLPELIYRVGVRYTVLGLCFVCLGLQLCFWLVPNIIAASVAITLFGLFSGPFFPVGMALSKELFPANYHPTALALVFVAAQCGGGLFPIITGIVASGAGVAVLQPILVGLIAATGISWLLVPKPKISDVRE